MRRASVFSTALLLLRTAAIARLYAADGIDAAYEANRRIRDQSVRRALIEGFVQNQPLDGSESLSVLEWALPAIGMSFSRLYQK